MEQIVETQERASKLNGAPYHRALLPGVTISPNLHNGRTQNSVFRRSRMVSAVFR